MIRERAKHRKNFLLPLILGVVLLAAWLLVFFWVPPETPFVPLIFLLLATLLVFLVTFLLLTNTRRGVLAALATAVFLTLGYYGAGNWLNLALLVGLTIAVEYYFSR